MKISSMVKFFKFIHYLPEVEPQLLITDSGLVESDWKESFMPSLEFTTFLLWDATDAKYLSVKMKNKIFVVSLG